MATALTVSYSAASSPGSPQAAIQLQLSLMRLSSIGAASRLVIASPTAMRPEAGASRLASGVRSPIAMASPRKPTKSASVTAQSATGTCHGPTIGSRWLEPPTLRSPMVIRKRFEATVGWRSTSKATCCSVTPVRSSGGSVRAMRFTSRLHLGHLAQQHVHRHVDETLAARAVFQHQLALITDDTDDGEGAALALGHGLEQRQAVRPDRQHVALLAFVAPHFLRRQPAFFQRHLAQVEGGAAAGAVHQLGEGIADAAGADVVDRQDRIDFARAPSSG